MLRELQDRVANEYQVQDLISIGDLFVIISNSLQEFVTHDSFLNAPKTADAELVPDVPLMVYKHSE